MSALHHDDFTEQMFRACPKGWYLRTNAVRHSDDQTERDYSFFDRDTSEKRITFRARRLPGCCGVLVLYYLRPEKTLDSKTARSLFLTVKELVIKAAGFAKLGQVLMTQTADSAGDAALVSGGHKSLLGFTNWKTKNSIAVYAFGTEKPPAPKPKAPEFDSEYGDY